MGHLIMNGGSSNFLINRQDIRQCHFPGDQNRAEDRYEEEAYNL